MVHNSGSGFLTITQQADLRDIRMGAAKFFGAPCRFLASGWRPHVVWFLLSMEIALMANILYITGIPSAPTPLKTYLTEPFFAFALVLFIIGLLFYAGWKAKSKVIIDEIADHTGKGEAKNTTITGISKLLAFELHRFNSLYEEVDDKRAIASVGGRRSLLDYTILVDDSGELLKNSISTSTEVKFWIFTIPIGALAGILGKIVQGPRISGSLHLDGNLFTLNAQISGHKAKSWKVEGIAPPDSSLNVKNAGDTGARSPSQDTASNRLTTMDPRMKSIDLLVKELAVRMYTDLTVGGSTKWRATNAFNQGLLEYRNCLLTKKDRLKNLKSAERMFLQAISEDNTFDLAWYNLGVVYTELENLEAAYHSFLNAIELSDTERRRWNVYYALALNRFATIRFENVSTQFSSYKKVLEEVVQHCTRAITLNENNPSLYDLRGVAHRILAEYSPDTIYKENHYRYARDDHQTAVKKSWRSLCSVIFNAGEVEPGPLDEKRKTAWIALWDLSRTIYQQVLCERAEDPGKQRDSSKPVPDTTPGPADPEPPVKDISYRNSVKQNPGDISVFNSAIRLLRQAISIERSDATIPFELGVVYYHMGKYREAIDSLRVAVMIDPTKLQYRAFLVLAYAKSSSSRKMDESIDTLLKYPDGLYKLSPNWKKRAHEIALDTKKVKILKEILSFEEDRNKFRLKTSDTSEENNRRILELEKPGDFDKPGEFDKWKKGIIAYEIAEYNRNTVNYENAGKYYKQAYELFADYPEEIKKKGIERRLAECLLIENKVTEAYRFIGTAFRANPVGFNEKAGKGEYLLNIGNYEMALEEFEGALMLKPYNKEILMRIGQCHAVYADNCHEKEDKASHLDAAIGYLNQVRSITEPEIGSSLGFLDIIPYKMITSYHIGRCYYKMGRYSEAIPNFEIAYWLMDAYPTNDFLITWMYLGYAHLYNRDHSKAEVQLRKIYQFIEDNMTEIEKEKIGNPVTEKSRKVEGEIPPEPSINPEDLAEWNILAYTGNLLNEKIMIGEIYIKALLGHAYSLLERDCGYDEAEILIEKSQLINKYIIDKDSEIGESIEAEILDRRGWLHYKNLKNQKLDLLTTDLMTAISKDANAEYHLHLAYIYKTLSEEYPDEAKKRQFALFADAHCQHALEMAPTEEVTSRAELLKSIITKKPNTTP